MRIALDIDGVLADFSGAAVQAICDLRIANLPSDYVHAEWSFNEVLQPGQWNTVFDYMLRQENMWLELSAFNDNCQGLRSYIEEHGEDDIYFVTSRPESAGACTIVQTQLWLAEKEIGQLGMPVFVTTDSKHKRQVLEGERIQFFLDDSPGNVRECEGLPNLRAFLLDRPYNQADVDLPRVYSVAEFLLEVEAAS
jgi:uncharacterized HAD superfamily protein